MSPISARSFLALLVAGTVWLAGCSSDGSGGEAGRSTTTRAGTGTSTVVAELGPLRPAATVGAEDPVALLDALLLDAGDLEAEGFVASPADAQLTPCGYDLSSEHPPLSGNGVVIASTELDLQFKEEVRVYATTSEATDAYNGLLDQGIGCGTAKDGDYDLTISRPRDVSEDVGGDRAGDVSAVVAEVSGGRDEGAVVAARVLDTLVIFSYLGGEGSGAATGAPSPLDVTVAGLAKVFEALAG